MSTHIEIRKLTPPLFPKTLDAISPMQTTAVAAPAFKPARVPAPLVSSTPAGKRYERSEAVENEISGLLAASPSDWLAKAQDLRNETLVFLIRRTRFTNDIVCGELLDRLQKRVQKQTKRLIHGRNMLARDEIVMSVEFDILQNVLAGEPSRKSDFLEIAFAQAVEHVTIDEIRKLENTEVGNRGEKVFVDLDDDGEEIERPLEDFLADEGASPETVLLNLEENNRRHQLLRKACDAVTDLNSLQATILHYGHDFPITSKSPEKLTLTRIFLGFTSRQIKYWITVAMKQMRAALGIEK